MIAQFINDIWNFIFIPVIFLILMKLFGRRWSEATQEAMKVGIGFIPLSMVVSFMLDKMQPAITRLSQKTGTSLSAVYVGGKATAIMGFGSSISAIVIPLCEAINIVMLVLRFTDCVNVDVFNLHQNASMGGHYSCLHRQLPREY